MAFQQPIYNPSVPFQGPIFGGLSDGKMVIIQGQVLPHIKRFAIDFACSNGDIAFHFNPRFDEGGVVVCNTFQHQQWGKEERKNNMPFQRGMYFEIIVNIKNHCFQVSVNGQHFLEYNHRIPLHTVQNVVINGDLTLNCINFTGPSVPSAYPPPPPYGSQPQIVSGMYPPPYGAPSGNITSHCVRATFGAQKPSGPVTVSNPSVPFHAAIVGNFGKAHRILIVGSVRHNADRFAVNLKNSRSNNIMLHANPRFREGAFVRNTLTNGSWGSEERELAFMPLSPGNAFQMEILNQNHGFKVSVNGMPVFEYRHRIPARQVDQIEIEGDVILSLVQY
ncbi:galectin-4-like isoform X2 [Ambystoma mexicanum]|uniref:galectin-4-like isoform X2 n=1 Tax=Ambystoma mexicanum TaxID=8296 RepID=UPI0037E9B20D